MLDYTFFKEVVIERNTEAVWSYLVGPKKNAWTKSSYRTISGNHGDVGEVFAHAHQFYSTDLIYTALAVVPRELLVLKISYKDAAGEDTLMGYDLLNLRAVAAGTSVTFQQAFSFPTSRLGTTVEEAGAKQSERLSKFFLELKDLVEREVPASVGQLMFEPLRTSRK